MREVDLIPGGSGMKVTYDRRTGVSKVVGRVSFKSIFAASESNLFRFCLDCTEVMMQLFTWEEARNTMYVVLQLLI